MTEEEARQESDELHCIQQALQNAGDHKLRCSRCGTELKPRQDCPECQKTWTAWLKEAMKPLIEERQRQKEAEIVASGGVVFDFSSVDE